MDPKEEEQLTARFLEATADSKKLEKLPSNDELLELYSLFKIANKEDISKVPAPSAWDFKGKAKHRAWKKTAEEIDEKVDGTKTADQLAKEQYIELVEKLKNTYGFDPNKAPEAVGSK